MRQEVDVVRVDNKEIDGAMPVVNYEHFEIHKGSHYFIEGHATLANGGELLVSLVVPDSDKVPHFVWTIMSSNILTTELYEGASGISGGSGVTPVNNNRNSTNTSTVTVTSGVSATGDGTLISSAAWSSRSGGETSRDDEIILKKNTTYLRKFISGANDNIVSFKASWYEHEVDFSSPEE